MTLRRTVELVAFALALLIAAMALHAWLVSRDEQQRLATTLAQQKQLLDAADTRESTRQSALAQTLAQIENLKRATQTPQQIVSAIPQFISLPQPITLTPTQQGTDAPNAAARFAKPGTGDTSMQSPLSEAKSGADSPDTALPSAPTAQIPTADLKPLYNYIQDCRSCQAQLASAKQNTADDASKIAALTKERDAAITASKGGTLWRRLSRNALWFALGAAATLAATKVPTHAHPNPDSTNLRQTPPNPITLQ
jgi:type II secretory pathway pseudopilin PulG